MELNKYVCHYFCEMETRPSTRLGGAECGSSVVCFNDCVGKIHSNEFVRRKRNIGCLKELFNGYTIPYWVAFQVGLGQDRSNRAGGVWGVSPPCPPKKYQREDR